MVIEQSPWRRLAMEKSKPETFQQALKLLTNLEGEKDKVVPVENKYTNNVENFVWETLKQTNLFKTVCPAPAWVDQELKIDGFLELPSGRILAIDVTFTSSDERKELKARKMAQPAKELPGLLKSFGPIPIIIFNFDNEKYREIVSGTKELEDPKTAQLEFLETIIEMVKEKRRMEMRGLQKQQLAKVVAFYQGYIEELEAMSKKLKDTLQAEISRTLEVDQKL